MQLQTITIKEYLSRKGISFRESNGELIAHCIFGSCDDDSKGIEAHLYFNAETGQYDCKKCGAQGNIFTLAKFFGDNPRDVIVNNGNGAEQKPKIPPKTLSEEEILSYHHNLTEKDKKWLTEVRGIALHIIAERKIGRGAFYYSRWLTIPTNGENGLFVKLRKDPDDAENKIKHKVYPPGNPATLFGKEILTAGTDYVIICEGELDMMVLESQGLVAVTSTAGAGTFKKEWIKYFVGIKEIIVCYDNDEEGENGAAKTLEILATGLPNAELFQIKLPPEVGEKGDVTDYFVRLGKSVDDFMALKQPYAPPTAEKERDPSTADELIQLVEENGALLFHDEFKEPMARLNINGHKEIWPCKSKSFKRWLANLYWKTNEKAPHGEAIQNALSVIEAKACFEGPMHKLENRVAFHEGAVWYDLTDAEWKTLKITENGWEIVTEPQVFFRRYSHQQAQVIPIAGGDVRKLLDFFSFGDSQQECLFLVLIVSFFVPHIPHPVPELHGPQGSAKTTRSRMAKRIVDPSAVWVLSLPTDSAQLVQQLSHHYVAFFDNVSSLPDWASDILCRAVTGEGTSKRQLYTDDEDIIYAFRRCIGINGINIAAHKADLLDRSILFGLERIQDLKRRTEAELWKDFEKELPGILGGVLDTLVRAMKILPAVTLRSLPRMADFAQWGSAIAQALGYTQQEFEAAYTTNIHAQNDEVLEGTPVATAMMAFMEQHDIWESSASDLLEELGKVAETEKIDTRAKKWPKAANSLTKRLNEVKPNLTTIGIDVEYIKDTSGKRGRWIKITKTTVATVAAPSSEAQQQIRDGSDSSDNIFSN